MTVLLDTLQMAALGSPGLIVVPVFIRTVVIFFIAA